MGLRCVGLRTVNAKDPAWPLSLEYVPLSLKALVPCYGMVMRRDF